VLLARAGSTLELNGQSIAAAVMVSISNDTVDFYDISKDVHITLFRWDVVAANTTRTNGSDRVQLDCSKGTSTFALGLELWLDTTDLAGASAEPGVVSVTCPGLLTCLNRVWYSREKIATTVALETAVRGSEPAPPPLEHQPEPETHDEQEVPILVADGDAETEYEATEEQQPQQQQQQPQQQQQQQVRADEAKDEDEDMDLLDAASDAGSTREPLTTRVKTPREEPAVARPSSARRAPKASPPRRARSNKRQPTKPEPMDVDDEDLSNSARRAPKASPPRRARSNKRQPTKPEPVDVDDEDSDACSTANVISDTCRTHAEVGLERVTNKQLHAASKRADVRSKRRLVMPPAEAAPPAPPAPSRVQVEAPARKPPTRKQPRTEAARSWKQEGGEIVGGLCGVEDQLSALMDLRERSLRDSAASMASQEASLCDEATQASRSLTSVAHKRVKYLLAEAADAFAVVKSAQSSDVQELGKQVRELHGEVKVLDEQMRRAIDESRAAQERKFKADKEALAKLKNTARVYLGQLKKQRDQNVQRMKMQQKMIAW
jgi:hypothetical protein